MTLERAAEIIQEAATSVADDWTPLYWQVSKDRLATDLGVVAQYPGRILDVGAAPYFTSLALQLQGRDIVAVDLDPSRLPVPGLDVVACNIETESIPVAEGAFDVVLFSEVFEHLRLNPPYTIRELHRVLAPGGVLLLTTPNLWSARGLFRLLVRRQAWTVNAEPVQQYARLDWVGHMGHVREYTAVEVGGVLRACGFDVERIIWRTAPGSRWARWAEWVIPPMRPYMTLVARKVSR